MTSHVRVLNYVISDPIDAMSTTLMFDSFLCSVWLATAEDAGLPLGIRQFRLTFFETFPASRFAFLVKIYDNLMAFTNTHTAHQNE